MGRKMKKLVTIIVPTYNSEKTIVRCLDSLLNQTIVNLIEIIVINDGSTDESSAILDVYVKKNPDTIQCITKNNSGVNEARNIGIKLVRTKYLGFVDSDDSCAPNMYEELLNEIITKKSDMVVSGIKKVFVDQNGEIVDTVITGVKENENMYDQSIFECPELFCRVSNYLCNKLFKTELFNDLVIFPDKLYKDTSIMPQVVLKSKKISLVNKAFYVYYKGSDNSVSYGFDNGLNIIEAHIAVIDLFKSKSLFDNFSKELEYRLLVSIYGKEKLYIRYGMKLSQIYAFNHNALCLLEQVFPDWYSNYYFLKKKNLLVVSFINALKESNEFFRWISTFWLIFFYKIILVIKNCKKIHRGEYENI